MEKHLVSELDFPRDNRDVLLKTKTSEYWIGYYINVDGAGWWTVYSGLNDSTFSTTEIECWWYLPE